MNGLSTYRRVFAFFAWTLVAIVVIMAPLVLYQLRAVRSQAEADAAAAIDRLLAPALEPALAGIEGRDLSAFAASAEGLLSEEISSIRLWGADGRLLAATDDATNVTVDEATLTRVTTGERVAVKKDSATGAVLDSYVLLSGGDVLEVQQEYGPIASTIGRSQRELLIIALAGSAAILLLSSVIYWTVTRGLDRAYRRLHYVHTAGRSIRAPLDLAEVLGQLAQEAAVSSTSDVCLITIAEDNGDHTLRASYDQKTSTTTEHRRTIEEWFTRRSIVTGELIRTTLDDLQIDSILGYERDLRGPVAILSVPIHGREGTTGVITVLRSAERGSYDNTEEQLVIELAAQGALAVEQAMLFAKMRQYAIKVETGYNATLKVLLAALEAKDAVTQGHSDRVAQLTVAVAKEMGIPDERLVDIERGSILHDIGKIGVPDEILKKPASLNEQEWEAMQKHPLLAGLMVSNVAFLEGAMPILLYHHEHYDGTGYPFGLEAAMIPLEARIFTVIDAYDAITSDRPYRSASSHNAALREIERNAGSQFDPDVVEVFIRIVQRMRPAQRHAA